MINPIEVKVYRPERRFGYGVMILGEDVTGQKYLFNFRAAAGSPDEWIKIEPNVVIDPEEGTTLYVDDFVLKQLTKIWSEQHPEPDPDEKTIDVLREALDDARDTRDHVLKMLDRKVPNA